MSPKRALVAGIAGLALVAVATIAILDRGTPPPSDIGKATPTGSPPAGGTPAAAEEPPPPARGVAFEARARSAQTTIFEPVTRRAIRLSGRVRIRAGPVDVRDATGATFRFVQLQARSSDLRIRARKITVEDGELTITPRAVRIGPAHGASSPLFTVNPGATLTGDGLTVVDGAEVTRLRSPVTVNDGADTRIWDLHVDAVARWHRGPSAVTSDGFGTVSWDGDGTVVTRTARRSARFMGVRGDLSIGIRRDGGRVAVTGRGEHTQVFGNGRCLLRTKATLRVTSKRRMTREPSGVAEIAWAPTNQGGRDACLTEVRGLTPAASWVRVSLTPLPPMFGGTDRTLVGGAASGVDVGPHCFIVCSPVPLYPLIAPGGSSERTLTVHVPADARSGDHLITLELRGNFSPIRTTVTVRVR